MMKRTISVLALALLAAGCGSADGESLATAEQPLIGGTATDAYDEVVVVYDQTTGGGCSGVLVAPNVVMTAAHCVAEGPAVMDNCPLFDTPADPADLIVGFGETMQQLTPGPTVTAVAIPPAEGCHNAVALLQLAEPVDAAVAVPRAPRLTTLASVDETFTAVGYGSSDVNSSDSGTRRVYEGSTVSCVGAGCAGASSPYPVFGSDAPVCDMDGGGPAIDAEGAVMGIAYFGGAICGEYTFYVHLPDFADWISTTLEDFGAPAGVGGGGSGGGGAVGGSGGGDPDADQTLQLDNDEEGGCSVTAVGSSGRGGLFALALALVALRRRRTS